MSRIGKLPIPIPKGVTVTVKGHDVTVKGPKGELHRTMHPDIGVAVEGETCTVSRPSDDPRHKSLHGLSRTLVANMVEGVTKGYSKQLEITGVGYKAEVRPYGLQLALGFSHPIEYKAPKGIKLTAPQPTQIVIEGANKQVVGQVAAEIRSLRPPGAVQGEGSQVRRRSGSQKGRQGGR